MNISTIACLLAALYFAGSLFILFVGGLLVRSDIHRAARIRAGAIYPTSRVLENLRPLQDLVVHFVGESHPCHQLLEYLENHNWPVPIGRLFQGRRSERVHGDTTTVLSSGEKIGPALFIVSVAGLVRFGRRGISVTNAGHEILSRIRGAAVAERTFELNAVGASETVTITEPKVETNARGKVHLSLVKDALQRMRHIPLSDRTGAPPGLQLGQVRTPPAARRSDSLEQPNVPTRQIVITAADHYELAAAIAAAKKLDVRHYELRSLQDKLANAKVVPAGDLPPDLITLNSRAQILDIATNGRLNLTVVFPLEANMGAGRVSVLDPLGSAMLGRRVRDEFEWAIPHGTRRLIVTAVHFQPEKALAMASLRQ